MYKRHSIYCAILTAIASGFFCCPTDVRLPGTLIHCMPLITRHIRRWSSQSTPLRTGCLCAIRYHQTEISSIGVEEEISYLDEMICPWMDSSSSYIPCDLVLFIYVRKLVCTICHRVFDMIQRQAFGLPFVGVFHSAHCFSHGHHCEIVYFGGLSNRIAIEWKENWWPSASVLIAFNPSPANDMLGKLCEMCLYWRMISFYAWS